MKVCVRLFLSFIFLLLGLFSFSSASIAAELDTLENVTHGGVTILDGDTVLRKDITVDSNFWSFRFDWPNAVGNQAALFVIFRGTFGDLEGGVPQDGVNYSHTFQSWPAENPKDILKQFGIPTLANASTTDGTYTAIVMERDPAFLDGFNVTEQLEWFASGGASGIAPLAYAQLVFEFREFAGCCSSVAFLPGIKANELYEGTDRRWLPRILRNDAERLEMTTGGESVNAITVGDPIEEVFGLVDVYGDFFDFLEGLVTDETIAEWESYPYDWRFDVFDVVQNDVLLHDGTTVNIPDAIRDLASRSDTGKVTLIGHSNGGLVGKALIDELGVDADLVDQFIMVGTPQLGTPSAIPALLHGLGEDIPPNLGLALDKATARDISKNMPGAYGLLPLDEYFNVVLDPVVEFDSTTALTTDFRNAYGDTIDTETELQSFLLGTGDGRPAPTFDDVLSPLLLNGGLLADAVTTRAQLEEWIAPAGLEVVQIVGWGLDTIRGVRYRERPCPDGSGCINFLDPEPIFTVEGDGTVVFPSAQFFPTSDTYFFDLKRFNNPLSNNSHKDLLGATPVQGLISEFLGLGTSTSQFVTVLKPELAGLERSLRVSIHSPVTLGVRDSLGRFTGLISNSDPTSNIPITIEEIPNSYYLEFGEGKYVGFEAGLDYELVLEGEGEGVFTLELEEVNGDEVVETQTYSDVPVTQDTIATLTLQDLSTTGDLEVDLEGDGVVDLLVEPDSDELTLEELLQSFRDTVDVSDMKKSLKKWLNKRLVKFEKHLDKNKSEKTQRELDKVEKKIVKEGTKGRITDEDTGVLLSILGEIRAKL